MCDVRHMHGQRDVNKITTKIKKEETCRLKVTETDKENGKEANKEKQKETSRLKVTEMDKETAKRPINRNRETSRLKVTATDKETARRPTKRNRKSHVDWKLQKRTKKQQIDKQTETERDI